MAFLIILSSFGLATAIVGKIKESSFFLWFLIGFTLPVLGLLAAILFRWESDEKLRRCERCGKRVKLYDQVCMACGEDLRWPEWSPP